MSCYHVTVKAPFCSFPVVLLSISFWFCLVHCEHPRFLVEIKTAVSHVPKNLIVSGAAIAPFRLWLPVTGGGRFAAGYLYSVLCSVHGPGGVLGYQGGDVRCWGGWVRGRGVSGAKALRWKRVWPFIGIGTASWIVRSEKSRVVGDEASSTTQPPRPQ